MTVYILLGGFNFENFLTLGVYSTRKKAKKALLEFQQSGANFDVLVIESRELDAAAYLTK